MISGEVNFISPPVYTKKFHNYPDFVSHSSYVLIPNFAAFRGKYFLIDNLPFHDVNDSSMNIFLSG